MATNYSLVLDEYEKFTIEEGRKPGEWEPGCTGWKARERALYFEVHNGKRKGMSRSELGRLARIDAAVPKIRRTQEARAYIGLASLSGRLPRNNAPGVEGALARIFQKGGGRELLPAALARELDECVASTRQRAPRASRDELWEIVRGFVGREGRPPSESGVDADERRLAQRVKKAISRGTELPDDLRQKYAARRWLAHSSCAERLLRCLLAGVFGERNVGLSESVGGREVDVPVRAGCGDAAVLYDGSAWHQDAEADERADRLWSGRHGLRVVRVREPGCPELHDGVSICVSIPAPLDRLSDEELLRALREIVEAVDPEAGSGELGVDVPFARRAALRASEPDNARLIAELLEHAAVTGRLPGGKTRVHRALSQRHALGLLSHDDLELLAMLEERYPQFDCGLPHLTFRRWLDEEEGE